MATASNQQLRQTLSLICSDLHILGISKLTPEAIRQAKFAGPAEAVLGRALHDLVILSLANFPESGQCLLEQYWHHLDCEGKASGLSLEGQQLVSQHLQHCGYRRTSFYTDNACSDSRELLLAFGWLLVHTQAFQHVLRLKAQQRSITTRLPPYPEDRLGSEEAGSSALHSSLLAQQHVQLVKQACSANDGWAQVQVASDHALMLLNKCRAKLRSLQSLQQSRLKLCHNIASTQHHAANTARHTHSPLTPYELSLLKSGDKLRRHCDSLQEAARIAAECNTTQHHVRMFFEWLGTVSQEQKGSLLASDPHHAQADIALTPSDNQTAGATLQQLQATARGLQPKLQTAMQQADAVLSQWPVISRTQDGQPMPLLHALQQDVKCIQAPLAMSSSDFRQELPADIQAGISQVRQTGSAQHLPWQGWQATAACMVHHHHSTVPTDAVRSFCAVAETDRLKDAVLAVAKMLSKTRAASRRSLQLVADSSGVRPSIAMRL